MSGVDRVMWRTAALLMLFAFTSLPAKAQVGGLGDGGDVMTQMAPMIGMMKAKMGKRRFGQMMQTVGPVMSQMMANGGSFGGGSGFAPQVYGMSAGGGDVIGMTGGYGGSEMMSMLPQLMQMANFGGSGYGHRRHRHRY